MPGPTLSYCAIDFGTSNSAIAIPADHGSSRLVELEAGESTMPTAVFYFAEHEPLAPGAEPPRAFGRAAIAAYVDGYEGRLMRSMKSILGSSLVEQTTDVGGGHAVKFLDVITGYLRHLRHAAETALGAPITQAVLGRPVFFVDGDATRDAQAQASLEAAARAVGLRDVVFQYEPIAAAFDFEQQATREQCVLVADIGGGTSDFSVVRVGPDRRDRTDRKDDILASHGVHIAGTDFDRRIELTGILRELGYGASGPARGDQPPREVPSAVYFDLATWHLINTVYQPGRVAELKNMAAFYADPRHHRRLLRTVSERLGHELLARAEAAKIAVADGADTQIDLDLVERALRVPLSAPQAAEAIDGDVERIVEAARQTVVQAGLTAASVDALYFTGGSTGLRLLTKRLAASFPAARAVRGDRLASVATGLGLHAQRRFAVAR
ncbi:MULTISPECIES: Hsp70 family protein [Methylibium]|uniref:Putative chaperone protein n=1 Tax=Methylibium petroleiphilum (strain ATCC BAA-1232 / LMG 22953 / PM1) TaxID=420662 RepID=A2SHX0_METPP|nr:MULTISPECIES: Hsp70 family protein [Methylibium]ABM95159.1 putative chaperone protein [Methylibium petroleiphilum PM1]EWS55517.1 Heat shock protein 70 [Methylibium sp. T29]EWS61473.1 Heat shock protein 70 [Methylibium sp. T29-B]